MFHPGTHLVPVDVVHKFLDVFSLPILIVNRMYRRVRRMTVLREFAGQLQNQTVAKSFFTALYSTAQDTNPGV